MQTVAVAGKPPPLSWCHTAIAIDGRRGIAKLLSFRCLEVYFILWVYFPLVFQLAWPESDVRPVVSTAMLSKGMSEPHTKFPHLVDALGSAGVYQNLEIHCLKQKLLLWYVHHWEQIHFICVPHWPPNSYWGHTVPVLIIHVLFVQATARFNRQMRKLRLSYGAVVSTHYLIVFFLLLAVYQTILHCIGEMRRKHGWCNQHHSNSIVVYVCWFHFFSLLKSVISQACEVVHISSFGCILVPFPILQCG